MNTAEKKRQAAIKREATLRRQLVEFIKNNPGCQGINVPRHLRYLLIVLNSEHVIQYQSGWRVVPPDPDLLNTLARNRTIAERIIEQLHISPADEALEDLVQNTDLFCPVMTRLMGPQTDEEFANLVRRTLDTDG